MALGSLVVEVAANVARFQSDMGKVAQIAENNAKQIDKAFGVVSTSLKSLGAGLLVGLTLDKIKGKIDDAINSAAGLQQLSEQTGATVEGLSALASVAKLSGTSTDLLAVGLQKLSKTLVDAQDGGKKSVEAFRAIGLSVEDIKGLKPDEAFLKISNRLATYADGAAKTAIAQQLLGKSGANLLPVAKDLADVGELQVKVTAAQAQMADEYEKNLIRLNAAQGAVYKIVAMELIPVFNAFTGAMLESVVASNGIRKSAQDLAKDGTIRSYAEDAAAALAILVDIAQAVAKSIVAIADSFKVVYQDTKTYWQFIYAAFADQKQLSDFIANDAGPLRKALDDRNATLKSAGKAYEDAINFTPFSERLKKQFDTQRAMALGSSPTDLARRGRLGGKAEIDFHPNNDTQSAGEKFIEQLQRQVEQQTRGKFEMLKLEAAQKGVSDAAEKYINKLQEIDGRNERIKRTVEEVAKAEEQRAKVTGLVTAGNDLVKSIDDQTEAMGLNEKELRRLTELRKLDEVIQRASANATSETADEIRKVGEVLRNNLITALDAAQKKQDELNASFSVGATRALDTYAKAAADKASAAENFVTGGLQKMEDALVQFAKTGKLSFSDLWSFMAEEFLRQQARVAIASFTSGGFGGLMSLFGGSKSPVAGGSGFGDYNNLGDASHLANGLPYVPFDGFPAILHEGERVMSKQENSGSAGGVTIDQRGAVYNVGSGVSRGEVQAAAQQAAAQAEARIYRSLRIAGVA